MMKLRTSGANFRVNGPQPNGQIVGRTPPTEPRVSTCLLTRAIEDMGAAVSFLRDAEIYRESSPASYLYKVITGTVRTFDPVIQDKIEAALRDLIDGTARAAGCTATIEYVRYYPATINDAECARHVLETSRALFGQALVPEAPAATSEDFAFMLRNVPGAYVWLGQGPGAHSASLHHPSYDFNDDVLPLGAALLAALAERRLAV